MIFYFDKKVTVRRNVTCSEEHYIEITYEEQQELVKKWCKERPRTVMGYLEASTRDNITEE